MPTKSLDAKLTQLRQNPQANAFILADAKDPDMAQGIAAPGTNYRANRYYSRAEFCDQIREVTQQGLVDIMLMSPAIGEKLGLDEDLFDRSQVTAAVRANDTSDIYGARASRYAKEPSYPFRSCTVPQLKTGAASGIARDDGRAIDLGLYSLTFNNDLDADMYTLETYHLFRLEAEEHGFRHFLEVFDPNVAGAVPPEQVGAFVNDSIVRTLAGIPRAGHPLFLKIAYHGRAALEELLHYDPTLIVGIMGGGAGTTHDAFRLLSEARQYGARAALFGRKIKAAEHPLTFIEHLRRLADAEQEPEDAVRSYHDQLEKLGIAARRSLQQDLQLREDWATLGEGGQYTTR